MDRLIDRWMDRWMDGRSIDRSIYSSDAWAHFQVFGVSFSHPRWSFWCPRDRFLSHFGVLGGILATLGPQGIPKRGRVEKVTKKVVGGSWPAPPLGTQIHQNSKTNDVKFASRFRHAFSMVNVSKSGGLDVLKP